MTDQTATAKSAPRTRGATDLTATAVDPLWYKDAVIYEVHVRAFFDSTDDGMGDFNGLTAKLDYLQDLGVTAIWLLPFYPSPWRDDGYDIAHYTSIHPTYGTMRDFRVFLREAHRRNLRVINELVINHTSDQHPWFERARTAKPGTTARDFYVWSDTPERYSETRIIFKDFETSNWSWDPVAQAYFWHRFYSHQPDLNFDNPAVHRAIFRVMDFWFKAGVDGMRLDAIPYLYEREGTNCENLPETHVFLKKLRAHLDSKFQDRMFLAEANQWPEETVPYFGDGDECHMSFHFPVMPRLFMSIQMEDRFPIVDILRQTPPIPQNCQWATFLRNHDELTLEMVTDEERDYMYRMYASDPQARINLGIRRRLAPLLQNNRRKIELMNALLFSLPGTPVLYYGDEIGMGDNIYLGDRNGVRTPMQWSADRNAGFSRANPQRLYLPLIVESEYHYETVNVEAQQANPSSLLWWTKRLIALRKRFRAFGRGSIEFVHPDNRKVLAFIRRYEDEVILVVANLSRFVQPARMDLSRHRDATPVELFGRTPFPPIGDQPYFLTLAPHGFYWFQLRPGSTEAAVRIESDRSGSRLAFTGDARALLAGDDQDRLEAALARSITDKRWFQGKARAIQKVAFRDSFPVPLGSEFAVLGLVDVDYVEDPTETYLIPLSVSTDERARRLSGDLPATIFANVEGDHDAVVHDALVLPELREALIDAIAQRRRLKGRAGEIVGAAERGLRQNAADLRGKPTRLLGAEQSNSSIVIDDAYVLKLYRRIESGTSLDLEVGAFLTARGFRHTPAVLGALEYQPDTGAARTIGVVQNFVPNEGDAWRLTRDYVEDFFERAAALAQEPPDSDTSIRGLLTATREPLDPLGMAGTYVEEARLIGCRTAELHHVLASEPADPAFAPEPFTLFYQRSLYQSMRNLAGRVLQAAAAADPPPDIRPQLDDLFSLEEVLMRRFHALIDEPIDADRIRCHGDYHLGQLLFTGNDFFITDFEGEPIRPLSERRLKRSPLRDVAGMLRSFHYAAFGDVFAAGRSPLSLEPAAARAWANYWYRCAAAAFLGGYVDRARDGAWLPADSAQFVTLLDAYTLEKAIYELGYELNNRPAWASLPLHGLLEMLREDS